jgi:hypothetical protein
MISGLVPLFGNQNEPSRSNLGSSGGFGGTDPWASADPELAMSMITSNRTANDLCFIFSPWKIGLMRRFRPDIQNTGTESLPAVEVCFASDQYRHPLHDGFPLRNP